MPAGLLIPPQMAAKSPRQPSQGAPQVEIVTCREEESAELPHLEPVFSGQGQDKGVGAWVSGHAPILAQAAPPVKHGQKWLWDYAP